MSNLTINANSIYDRVIRIGRQTENLVSEIIFNLQMWIEEYGAGECVLNVRRNGDGSAYPVPMTITDGLATWTITDTDTAKKGRGEIQLVYRAGDKVKTSPIFTISCGESLVGDGEPPSGYEDWLTELGEMTAQVEAAKTSASASAQTAQTAAGTAAEKATEAEQSANTASGFANNASASAQSANTSAQAAKASEEKAKEYAEQAEHGGGGGGAVQSVNGKTGAVVLTASDVGALPSDTPIPSLTGYATEDWTNQQLAAKASRVEVLIDNNVPSMTFQQIYSALVHGDYVYCDDYNGAYNYVGIAPINNVTCLIFGFSVTYQGQAFAIGYAITPNNTAIRINDVTTIPTVTNDFTDAYKNKVDALWSDYQSAMTALGIGGE